GTFLCTHAVLSNMVSRGTGRIVNVVSLAALTAWPYDTAYGCSKAAVIRLTDSIAAEARQHGVYAFALSPGSVDTDLRSGALDGAAGRAFLGQYNVSPRFVPPELPAEAVVFLVSGRADGLTGRVLSVDWDLPALAERA